MPELDPGEFIALMQDVHKSKSVFGSFSYQVSGGRFTLLTVQTGSGLARYHIRAELFPEYAFFLEPGTFYPKS